MAILQNQANAVTQVNQYNFLPAIPCGPAPTPATPASATVAPAAPDPQAVAVSYWKTIPLPVPHPTVPPGYAITGKSAYLVTGGTTNPPTYSFATPLGRLTIEASGQYMVDWGDPLAPGWQGPYPYEGVPWPDGRITHVYDDVGIYTVTVAEEWSATWQLGAASGYLNGLRTKAVIPGFQVEQLQAVLTN